MFIELRDLDEPWCLFVFKSDPWDGREFFIEEQETGIEHHMHWGLSYDCNNGMLEDVNYTNITIQVDEKQYKEVDYDKLDGF